MSYVNNVRMFVRVFELGSMSAAARDQRVSPAVASSRIAELEKHLGVRLFNRTTRKLTPTEHGKVFHDGALKILETIERAEAAVAEITNNPRGSIFVAAPLGVGRRFLAPHIPAFKDIYPDIEVRLRLSARKIDVAAEGLDMAFLLGVITLAFGQFFMQHVFYAGGFLTVIIEFVGGILFLFMLLRKGTL